MRTTALLSLLAGVASVASAASTKPFGLPKPNLSKKDIHYTAQAEDVVKPKVFIISMVCMFDIVLSFLPPGRSSSFSFQQLR